MRWTRAIVVALALVASPTAVLIGSYEWFRARSVEETLRRGLQAAAANGIKHAFAAAETYALLRLILVPPEHAIRIVDALGRANEWAEFYGRSVGKRDPTREIYKDLWNNAAGLVAAEQLETLGRSTSDERLRLVGDMTEQGLVLQTFMDPQVPDFPDGTQPETSDLHLALSAFRRDKARTLARLHQVLR